ncbi:ABC transporter permease [Bacillus tropicus]|uniref:ABC transporter permease n=1 Tax=Bacillus tropicus TaxID=2026188 RepID=UPI002AA58AAC
MQIFKLYMKRTIKRKWTVLLLMLLPIIFAFLVAAQYQKTSHLTLTTYAENKSMNINEMKKLKSLTEYYNLETDYSEKEKTNVHKEFSTSKIELSNLEIQNAYILTSTFNMIVSVMVFLSMINTLLFLRNQTDPTTERILLTVKNKFSYYLQVVGAITVVTIAQLVLMIILIIYFFKINLIISMRELSLLLLVYGLLIILVIGLGLILRKQTAKSSTGRLLVIIVALLLTILGGTLWPIAIMPEGLQAIAKILPTYWVTEINGQVFYGLVRSGHEILIYIIALFSCICLIFFMLTRMRNKYIW